MILIIKYNVIYNNKNKKYSPKIFRKFFECKIFSEHPLPWKKTPETSSKISKKRLREFQIFT